MKKATAKKSGKYNVSDSKYNNLIILIFMAIYIESEIGQCPQHAFLILSEVILIVAKVYYFICKR